jgi:hypothetical protein
MRLSALALAPLALSWLSTPAPAQEPVDHEAIMRIREEGLERSQIMDTLWWLTDRYGPRLTNSPQERRALQWAKERLTEHGLADARLESWGEFGLGWSFEKCTVEMTAPIYMPLIAIPKAWTSGLAAPVAGEPVLIEAETAADLEKYAGKLAGRIVLNGKAREVGTKFEAHAERHDDDALDEIVAHEPPEAADSDRTSRRADWARRRELSQKLREMMKAEGAACVIEPDSGSRNDYGVILLGSGGSRDPEEERALPQVVVSAEQYNRIARLLQKGEKVELAVDVRTTFYAEDLDGYNLLADIPGTDLAHEVVMMGGHFDSWHPATGATDNAIGSAVAMEAARILLASGLAPRRTIRLALWTGEEQGLLGSRGFAAAHFGDKDTRAFTEEHANLAAYFNLDNGGGRIRGIYAQGNAACRPIFEAWLAPFHDLAATTVTTKDTGGTDHLSFDGYGLPGFQFIQDPLDYSSRTHHTNMDHYDRVIAHDARQAATIMAAFAYHAAMRPEKLPRKPLPAPEPRRGEAPSAGAPVPTAAPAGAVPANAPSGGN